MSEHIGRSWTEHPIEDTCPCPQEPCGLIGVARIDTVSVADVLAFASPWFLYIREGHRLARTRDELERAQNLTQEAQADAWDREFERAHEQHYAEDLRLARCTPAVIDDNPYLRELSPLVSTGR